MSGDDILWIGIIGFFVLVALGHFFGDENE